MSQKFVSYIRVSTEEQGDSRLGIEAQQRINRAFIESTGGELVREEIEVETGKVKLQTFNVNLQTLLTKRPKLRDVIEYCIKNRCGLVVKDLSRLGRSVLLISYLQANQVNFVCAESPNDDYMVHQMKAVIAEDEGRKISIRTKQALHSLKVRGKKLGNPNPESLAKGRQKQAQIKRERAKEFYSFISPRITRMRTEGKSLRAIASELNLDGVRTKEGKKFTQQTVRNILDRANQV